MSEQDKLEHYLHELEEGLSQLSPSNRAKIIYDTHQHVHQVRQNYPDKSISQILEDLGSASKLANHHLLDHNLKTYKPKRSPLVKWLGLSFIGAVSAFFIFILVLVFKFSPVFKIDEKNQRLIILGGLIDLNGSSGKMKIFDQYQFVASNKYTNQFNGSVDVPKEEVDEVVINFSAGTINLKTSVDRRLIWDCKLENEPTSDFITMGEIIDIDMEKTGGANCELTIPADLKLTLYGGDGQVSLFEPEFDSYIEIKNGNVLIKPSPELDYKFNLSVKNGFVGNQPKSSVSPDAYEIRARVENGKIDMIND